jgi:class 3 adenylate cyclase
MRLWEDLPDGDLIREIGELLKKRDELEAQRQALVAQPGHPTILPDVMREIKATRQAIIDHENLLALVAKIHPEAVARLRQSRTFRKHFFGGEEKDAFIMSVDIRRSTELMLKATSAEAFAKFISILCEDLVSNVVRRFGVVDKFTGDGLLSFFPKFYTGEDAGQHALLAAQACHESFKQHYLEYRHLFRAVLAEVGLGIGLDYGPVHLVELGGALTAIGNPVVYACRLASAPAGKTYLNQGAFDEVMSNDRDENAWLIEEVEIDIKHEGKLVAYEVTDGQATRIRDPQEGWPESDKAELEDEDAPF